MVETVRAERFYADSKTIAVEDIPIPEPGPGEVLVKVAFCGICHSDIVSLEDVRVGIEKLDRQEGNPIRILVRPWGAPLFRLPVSERQCRSLTCPPDS